MVDSIIGKLMSNECDQALLHIAAFCDIEPLNIRNTAQAKDYSRINGINRTRQAHQTSSLAALLLLGEVRMQGVPG
ncbi:hypothetical protein VIMY103929_11030 [Vibrio mytili]|uniref:Uncharacterized protein n=2 Tax=Vibrio mytili TaxID=50718 RepID=A0A0C3IAD5_9VIBR|nr:hypothetical protein SU60_08560 [Vibrio mytili]